MLLIRLLMFVYVLLIKGEGSSTKPRRLLAGRDLRKLFPWQVRKAKEEAFLRDFMALRNSRAVELPGPTRTQPAMASTPARDTPATPQLSGLMSLATGKGTAAGEPKHKLIREVIPASLVEHETETAVILQMPSKRRPVGRVYAATARDHYNSPIGRTLTREFVRRDPTHCPRAALRHLPLEDLTRELAVQRNVGSQPTSPASAQAPKGRATPKRPKRKQRDW